MASVSLLSLTMALLLQQSAPAPALDFEFFKARVQPIFTTKRPGNARCVSCHASGTPMRLQALSAGSATWNDEQSRKNFESVSFLVTPGNPNASRLLIHPLSPDAGGDLVHGGGRQFASKDDPDWKAIAAWVRAAKQ